MGKSSVVVVSSMEMWKSHWEGLDVHGDMDIAEEIRLSPGVVWPPGKRHKRERKERKELEEKLLFQCARWDLLEGACGEKLRSHRGWGSLCCAPAREGRGSEKIRIQILAWIQILTVLTLL